MGHRHQWGIWGPLGVGDQRERNLRSPQRSLRRGSVKCRAFSAKGGLYTLDATNFVWDDAGSDTFQAPGTLSASGKLGNGSWHKIAQESN